MRQWGFVIYRCTYEDDAAWAQFLTILRQRAREALEEELALEWYRAGDSTGHPQLLAGLEEGDGGEDTTLARLMDALDWNVQDDAALFDGASKSDVRNHFKAWVRADAEQQVLGSPVSVQVARHQRPAVEYENPRYRFPIYVDAAALDSVIHQAPRPPEPDNQGVGYLVLIDSDSGAYTAATPSYPQEEDGNDGTEGCESPVEGCSLYDVGWMKVGVDGLVPAVYASLLVSDWFQSNYVRPPEVLVL